MRSEIKKIRALIYFLFIIYLFFYTIMNAQGITHAPFIPIVDSLQFSSLGFNRMLNTYTWSGDFRKVLQVHNWKAEIRQLVRSCLVKSDQKAIQDEYHGIISLSARLSDELNLQLINTSNVLANNRVIDLGRMAQHQFLAGLEYFPWENVRSSVSGGYELNSQEDEDDNGFVYKMSFDVYNVKLEEFNASLRSSLDKSFLGRRSPGTGDARLILLRDFGGGVSDSLIINYGMQRSEYYTGLSSSSQSLLGIQHNIFRRDAEVFEIVNQIKYGPDPGFSLSASFGLSSRSIKRGYRYRDNSNSASLTNSNIQEMQFFGVISLLWSPLKWLDADIRIHNTEKDERYSVDNASVPGIDQLRAQASKMENTAQRTMISAALDAGITDNDNLRLVSSTGILRYDTPDASNTDDRDELLITSGLEYQHRFSPQLLLSMTGDLTLFHLVYIRPEQSANNNWNRIIRLSPSVEYTPSSRLRTVLRTEVLANYTISDYEQQRALIRSFSYRQAMWADSTIFKLSDNIECNFSGSLRIFERGTLKWDEFKEKPEEYFVEKNLWPEIIWSSGKGLKIGIGYRYYGQDSYKYQKNERVFNQGIETLGPTVLLEWQGTEMERIMLSGWREVQKYNGVTKATISNLSIQIGFIL